jgi:hypothetical protein
VLKNKHQAVSQGVRHLRAGDAEETADTVNETTTMSAENSCCSTGKTGWVIWMFVNVADTRVKTVIGRRT